MSTNGITQGRTQSVMPESQSRSRQISIANARAAAVSGEELVRVSAAVSQRLRSEAIAAGRPQPDSSVIKQAQTAALDALRDQRVKV